MNKCFWGLHVGMSLHCLILMDKKDLGFTGLSVTLTIHIKIPVYKYIKTNLKVVKKKENKNETEP